MMAEKLDSTKVLSSIPSSLIDELRSCEKLPLAFNELLAARSSAQ
jgi:hypothetical protein